MSVAPPGAQRRSRSGRWAAVVVVQSDLETLIPTCADRLPHVLGSPGRVGAKRQRPCERHPSAVRDWTATVKGSGSPLRILFQHGRVQVNRFNPRFGCSHVMYPVPISEILRVRSSLRRRASACVRVSCPIARHRSQPSSSIWTMVRWQMQHGM